MKVLDEQSERGVTERRFDSTCDGRTVPGILWTPADVPAKALVLIGHGYTLHKRIEYALSLARRLVRHHGIAAAAIDGPHHGDRSSPAMAGDTWWSHDTTEEMIADWKQVLADVRARPDVGDVPLGYWGMSMGTIFGLPFVASEPSVRVAVLGLMGLTGPTRDRVAADAARIDAIPVLFLFQWDDGLFTRQDGIDLFTALGTPDKRMHVNPGAHSAVPPAEFVFSERFLAERLLPT